MQNEIGKFVQWARPITIDLTRGTVELTKRLVHVFPAGHSEKLVDVPASDQPHEEVLDLRCKSF